GGALQVVEAVAVLQLLELVLEHEVEGRAEQAAERHLLLGQAADPQVDAAEAGGGDAIPVLRKAGIVGPGTGAVEEVQAVCSFADAAQDDEGSRCALVSERGGGGDQGMRAVGGNEV